MTKGIRDINRRRTVIVRAKKLARARKSYYAVSQTPKAEEAEPRE